MQLSEQVLNGMRNGSVSARWLISITVMSRTNTAISQIHLSTFEGDLRINIGGLRNYVGAGAILGIPEIVYETGTVIQNQRFTLSILSPEVIKAVKTLSPRLSPVEMRLAFFDIETGKIIDTPVAYEGTTDDIKIIEGENARCEMVVASLNRSGTQTLPHKKSDSAQRERTIYSYSTPDDGRKYASVAGTVSISWGQSNDSVFRMKNRG